METKIGVDSNILVFTHREDDPHKMMIAKWLVDRKPLVSTVVISEYLNAVKKKFRYDNPLTSHDENVKITILSRCRDNLIGCPLFPVSVDTLYLAEELIRKYKFQLFDSIVVAAAVEAGCETLYSDDMHHKLTVNKQLTIVNPFLR